ncbi:RagB/SusD family nutrient uptake outer membrane protein [Sinomicrobium sp.]
MKKFFHIIAFLTVGLLVASCDKYLDIEPEGRVIPKTLEENRAMMTTAYSAYPKHKSRLAFRTDELVLDELGMDVPYYLDVYRWQDVNPDPQTVAYPWIQFYNTIFYTNHIINEGVNTIEDSAEKDQLVGEAYALRAYAYFDLINMYGKPFGESSATDKGVPLALEIDLEQVFKPSPVAEVYEQILSDLDQAISLLTEDSWEAGYNYRFSLAAAYGFKARVHLYMQQWDKALEAADKALSYNNTLVNLNDNPILPNSYNSPESILALEDVYEAAVNNAAYISDELIAEYDATNDLRFGLYFVPSGSQYKTGKGGAQEFKCSIRTSELYLIKAEALMQLDRLEDSKTALFSLLENRYATAYFPTLKTEIEQMDKADYGLALLEERRKELALEGHRWFDLRRSDRKEIQHSFDGEVYTLQQEDPRYTLPYPSDARLNNPEL